MQIEIDDEVATVLAGDVLIQHYNNLREDPYIFDDKLLQGLMESFRVVIDYCTTESQRVRGGMYV